MPFLSPTAFATAMPRVMPMSSTVWWASISRSPLARTVRSMAPWRATWSSMWSRKGMPEASLASPVPSRFTATKICVSRVSRWISAVRMSGEDVGEGGDEPVVLVGRADGEAKAVREQRVGTVEGANQYTTRLEALERAGRIGKAGQDEVRGRGETPYPRQAIERAFEAGAPGDQARGLGVEHLAVAQHEVGGRGREHVHVVGQAELLQLVGPGPWRHRETQAQ